MACVVNSNFDSQVGIKNSVCVRIQQNPVLHSADFVSSVLVLPLIYENDFKDEIK